MQVRENPLEVAARLDHIEARINALEILLNCEEFLPVKDAAQVLNCSTRSLYQAVRNARVAPKKYPFRQGSEFLITNSNRILINPAKWRSAHVNSN